MKLTTDNSGTTSAEPWVKARPNELAPWLDEQHLPRPQTPTHAAGERPAAWKLALCVGIELILFALHYNMLEETLDTIGVEINKFFADDVLFGFVFDAIPQLTAKELLAFVTAIFFIATPIYVWLDLLTEQTKPRAVIVQRIVRTFFWCAYAWIVAAEYIMINHRIALSAGNVFGSQSGHEPALAVFFSVLFIVVNATVAFTTAYLYHGRQFGRRS